MKYLWLLFLPCLLFAQEAEVTWNKVTTNSDGTPIKDLAGYKLYYGTVSGSYDVTINLSLAKLNYGEIYYVKGLDYEQTYYFTLTAYDSVGNESGFAKEVALYMTPPDTIPPSVPDGFDVKVRIILGQNDALYHEIWAESQTKWERLAMFENNIEEISVRNPHKAAFTLISYPGSKETVYTRAKTDIIEVKL